MRSLKGGPEGAGLRIGIVVSRFNQEITDRLLEGALDALRASGVDDASITVASVPGAFEIPGAAQKLAPSVDAIVTLGAVIRGETEHFAFVAGAAQSGVLRVALDSGIPVTFGVLTTEDMEQAMERSGGAWGNKGEEAAMDAVEMANLYRDI